MNSYKVHKMPSIKLNFKEGVRLERSFCIEQIFNLDNFEIIKIFGAGINEK